jgi:hypothetical protein
MESRDIGSHRHMSHVDASLALAGSNSSALTWFQVDDRLQRHLLELGLRRCIRRGCGASTSPNLLQKHAHYGRGAGEI